ncbi:MAG: hypothetical protein HY808_09905 [Nitrospirae bacterium]|nr:hypothetical protein [Nitrospirota bacterium]
MLKGFFKLIVFILLVIFISIGLATWKGGEPFRWLGRQTVGLGETIQKFGNYVDDIRSGSEEVKKTFDLIKEAVSPDKEKTKKDDQQ